MAPVKLYIYDLSNGMARTMSRQLTGIQIDGVWHTSVVVFGKEVFYGQGISICPPGGSHLGRPLEIHDLGETEIDEVTFMEFIDELRGHYTAEKYHLLEFNCNSFTNDIAGFLTGGSIPPHIKDLPATFLSTPFGQSLRPMIDSMYRGPAGAAYPTPAATPPSVGPTAQIDPGLASSLLRSVAAQAAAAGPSGSTSGTSLVSPLHISTNVASLESINASHRNVIVLLSAGTDKTLEQAFEQIAREQVSKSGLAFVKVDTQVGTAQQVAKKYAVVSSHALLCIQAGHVAAKAEELSRNNIREKIIAFINGAYPVHPHTASKVPAIMALSIDPILYTQLPSIDIPINKLIGFIESAQHRNPALDEAKSTLKSSFATYLKKRFPPGSPPSAIIGKSSVSVSPTDAKKWISMNRALLDSLPPENLFPLVDLYRLSILDTSIASKVGPSIILTIEQKLAALLASASSPSDVPRPLMITALRLCANAFAHPTASDNIFRPETKDILVSGLLHPDASVRTGAASLAFNVATRRHAPFRTGKPSAQSYNWAEVDRRERNGEGGQDIELVVALLEATERETNEEVVHRLIASLAMLIYLSPQMLERDSDLHGTLEVLSAKDKLNAKLVPGGCGPKGITKTDIRNLVAEVASLCP